MASVITFGTAGGLLLSATPPAPAASEPPTVAATVTPVATHSAAPTPTLTPQRLVAWRGPVEHLFFHPLVLRPRLAFTDDVLGQGFQDYFVTAREFKAILDELWRNGWTLVDAGRAALSRVRVPPGRKPLVLSEDDANYYRYFRGRGLASRLVLNPDGDVRAEYRDAAGRHLTSDDFVPLVDEAVRAHPEFSADGAKGVLALTGYEGLFGERRLGRPAARTRVRALASRLRSTGWTFASHTFGHITLAEASVSTIRRDTASWKDLTADLIGPVDLLAYPYGSRPSPSGRRLLRGEGFRIQFDIDSRARVVKNGGVIVMSRRHIDGLAFESPGRLAPLFNVARILDPMRPALR